MSAQGDWTEAVERLKSAIVAKVGTLAAFARQLEMDPTQLSATLRPHRRPTVETLDRFSVVLGYPPNELRRWYGYLRDDQAVEPLVMQDKKYDPARVIAFVESHPDDQFCATLAREKARRTREGYEWLCFRIFRAWTSNAELAMDILTEALRES